MNWHIDPSHSAIFFTARHMMVAKVRGRFEQYNGTIAFDADEPTITTVRVEIDAASLNTEDEQRDNHLRSADFLDVTNYPVLTFESKRVERKDKTHGRLIGDLTIRGMTREVALDVEYHGQYQDPWGGLRAGFSGSTTINRKDWGLTWNVALEAGGFLVSDKVGIEIELELVRQTESQAA